MSVAVYPFAMNTLLAAVSLSCGLSLSAQSFTLSAPVVTTLLVQTAQGTQTNPISAGLVGSYSTVVAQLGLLDSALWHWSASTGSTAAGLTARVRLDLANPGVASVRPGELLFTLVAPAGGFLYFDCAITVQAPSGAPVPRVEIDIGADGTPELTQASIMPQTIVVPARGLPMPFLVTIDAALAAPGSLIAEVRITARPSNGVTANRVYAGCVGVELLNVAPTWSGGIQYGGLGGPMAPVFAVFGLHVQPTLLPAAGVLPCILFPSPDVIVFLPNLFIHTLQIPAAARPIDFWLEGINAFGLESSWTYWVQAY